MPASYFIVITGQPSSADTEVMAVFAFSAREAHESAAKEYRAKRDLPLSIHISTLTAKRVDTEEEAHQYINRLGELMEENERSRSAQ